MTERERQMVRFAARFHGQPHLGLTDRRIHERFDMQPAAFWQSALHLLERPDVQAEMPVEVHHLQLRLQAHRTASGYRRNTGTKMATSGGYPGGCGGCDLRWNSPSQAHCPTCHEQFGTVRGFDLHLPVNDTDAGPPAPCIPPDSLGGRLVLKDGVWRQPMEIAALERLHNARTSKDGPEGQASQVAV